MNFFEITELPRENEIIDEILDGKNVRIERIVSAGHVSPEGFWYDQDENEWVILMQGEAVVMLENGPVEMRPGTSIFIEAHRKHYVSYTSAEPPCIWLCVFEKNK